MVARSTFYSVRGGGNADGGRFYGKLVEMREIGMNRVTGRRLKGVWRLTEPQLGSRNVLIG